MKPHGIPDNYVQTAPGVYEHPSRVRLFGPMPDPKQLPLVATEQPKPEPCKVPWRDDARKRIRQSSKPLLNKLETEWLSVLQQQCGAMIYAQSMRFKLANGIWYKPDFVVFYVQSVTAYECKGPHAFRGGFENLKVAAHQYPNIRWSLIWKENNQWKEQTVLP